MDLTIINSINNNTYANNLHIQNTHPKRILYLLKQIAKLVDKTFTDNEPYIAINNIIKTAYEKYNNHFDYLESYGQQKQGNLDRQVNYILSNRNDLKNVLVLKELGSGLNNKRKKLLKLIDMILNDEVNFITNGRYTEKHCIDF